MQNALESPILIRRKGHVIEVPQGIGVDENQGLVQNPTVERTTDHHVGRNQNLGPFRDTEGCRGLNQWTYHVTEVHRLVHVVENQGRTQKPKAVKFIGPLVGADQNLDQFQSTESLVLNRRKDHVIEVPREIRVGESQGQAQNLMAGRAVGPLVGSDRNLDPVPDTEGNPVRIRKIVERGIINIPDPNHLVEDGPVRGLKYRNTVLY